MSGETVATQTETIEDVIRVARASGVGVVRSESKRLILDLDDDRAVAQYGRVLPIVDSIYGAAEMYRWKSKSGNLHVVVRLDTALGLTTRLGLQAMLGSDGVKEVLSLKRAKDGEREPSVLFRPADSV